jgi:hypothetical protein
MTEKDYKGKWLVELMKTPAIRWYENDEPQTTIHNHYYIYNDNRVFKVTEDEFRTFVKGKKIIGERKLLSDN